MLKLGDLDLERIGEQVLRLPTTAREGLVLLRSGLGHVTRPDEMAYSLMAMRR